MSERRPNRPVAAVHHGIVVSEHAPYDAIEWRHSARDRDARRCDTEILSASLSHTVLPRRSDAPFSILSIRSNVESQNEVIRTDCSLLRIPIRLVVFRAANEKKCAG